MTLAEITNLHFRVLHSPDRQDPELVSDKDVLLETAVIAKCAKTVLSIVCKECFGERSLEETNRKEERPIVDSVLAPYRLYWKTKPYRIENRKGDVVKTGKRFDITKAGIKKAVVASRKARTRKAV